MTSPCNNPAEAAQPDEFFPACPTCHSQGRRCVNPDGSLAWPWHTSRAVLRDAEWLASDRVGMGFTDTLKDTTAHVAAYLAGVADARQGTVVVDPDAVLPDLIAALEILRDTVAPRA